MIARKQANKCQKPSFAHSIQECEAQFQLVFTRASLALDFEKSLIAGWKMTHPLFLKHFGGTKIDPPFLGGWHRPVFVSSVSLHKTK